MKTFKLFLLGMAACAAMAVLAQPCPCHNFAAQMKQQRELQFALDYIYYYQLDRNLDRRTQLSRDRAMLDAVRREAELKKQLEAQKNQLSKLEALLNQQLAQEFKLNSKMTKEQLAQYKRQKEELTKKLAAIERQLEILASTDADACYVAYLIKSSSLNPKCLAEVKERFHVETLMGYVHLFSEDDLLLMSHGHNPALDHMFQ